MVRARPLLIAAVLAAWCAPTSAAADETAVRASGPVGLPAATVETRSPADGPLLQDPAPAPPAAAETPALLTEAAPAAAAPTPSPPSLTLPSAPPTVAADPRRLARPSSTPLPSGARGAPQLIDLSWDNLPLDPVSSAAALALVVGLLLLTVAVLKRAAPKSQRVLPGEVASVVGRVPLGGKQTAHLLKVGSKLVLVHITPDGAKPLTEVTDPAEVSRLLGLCEQGGEHSSSTAFADVFDKLASEAAAPSFLGDESTLVDRRQLAAAYAKTPGGRGDL